MFKKIIIIIVSVGIGFFVCDVFENTALNIWLARGIGALVTAIAALIFYHFFIQESKDIIKE